MQIARNFPRRLVLGLFFAGAGAAVIPKSVLAAGSASTDWENLSEDEWRSRLSPAEFRILRREGTEKPYSSALNDEKRKGTYVCAGCALPLFSSETKYDSGTGWPSFYRSLPDAVDTKRDYKMVWPRTEYHCSRCGGHQGHIFDDGPRPTGKRYCNNGLALDFVPTEKERI